MIFFARFCAPGFVLAALAFHEAAAAAPANDDVVLHAMGDELARSVMQLNLEKNGPPYFASYRVDDTAKTEVTASFGSLVTTAGEPIRNRSATVELRVGSMQFDQTNYLIKGAEVPNAPRFTAELPLDDSYTELRRQLWLLTDRAYRGAVEELANKKASLQNKTRPDDTADFTSEPPTQTEDLAPPFAYDAAATVKLARELSAVFRDFPAIENSSVSIRQGEILSRYCNSEGTRYLRRTVVFSIVIEASAQAPDGRVLSGNVHHLSHSASLFPSQTQLLAEVRDLSERLTASRNAALPPTYNGPILFEGEAALTVLMEGIVKCLMAQKRPVLSYEVNVGENPFQDKIGGRVLPPFLSVTDNPTLTEIAGYPLLGTSPIDDEGVPTHPVKLIEKGRLKTLLTDRVPSLGLLKSTGSRRGGGPVPSNLIVSAENGLTPEALKERLVKLAQERGRDYGVIVRRLAPEITAVKVFPDGHEEPVRNAELTEVSLDAFKEIVSAGSTPFADYFILTATRPAREPSNSIVSLVAPALLFDDLTLKTAEGEIPTLPVAKHPYFDK